MTTAEAAPRAERNASGAEGAARPRRGTRAEQRVATRRRLLDATIECLDERGYAHTTTLEVQARAGVSRGTLLHQFGSRNELLVAAIEHLASVRFAAFREEALAIPRGSQGFDKAIDVMTRLVVAPQTRVVVELWNASRTEPGLADAMRRHELFAHSQLADLFDILVGPDVRADPRYPVVREVVLHALAGVSLGQHLRSPRYIEIVSEQWKELGRDLGKETQRG